MKSDRRLTCTIACGPAPAPLFAGVDRLDRVIVMDKRPGGRHWWHLWREVSGLSWTHVVDLRRSAISYLLLARHRHRLTRRDSDAAPLHRVRLNASVLGLESDPPAPVVPTREADRAAAAALLGPEEGPGPGAAPGGVAAIAPAANWAGKQWPTEHWIALVRRLFGADGPLRHMRVVVLGAPSEGAVLARVMEAVPSDRLVDGGGGLGLLQVQAVLERCGLFIGNDSGLMHMAAAAGIPTLGLFGPSDDRRFGPWGANARMVRTPESHAEWQAYMARPDFDHRTTGSLMASLTVDRVAEAALGLREATA